MSLYKAIKALEALKDSDGTMKLNQDQTLRLFQLLWDVYDSNPKDVRDASLDLLGTLDVSEKEVSA